jgi:hypothetical protein
MDLVTKVILVLAIFFIFAEFFDAVNDHFGLSNLITQMVNSFRSMTTIIPEILLVFFIVMTFSKAVKSVGAFNEQAAVTAKWDNETRQQLKDGKNPAYAMLEFFFGALKDATLLSLGTITGKQDAYQARKEKEAKEIDAEVVKEAAAIDAAAKKQSAALEDATERKKILTNSEDTRKKLDALKNIEEKKIERDRAAAKLRSEERAKARTDKLKLDAQKNKLNRMRLAFQEKQQKVKQDYELKRLQLEAKNDKEIGERQIEMAMLLGSGGNLGVSPLQIKQMMIGDSGFKAKMENAIKSGQDVSQLIKDQVEKSKASASGMLSVEENQIQKEREKEQDKKLKEEMDEQMLTAENIIAADKKTADDKETDRLKEQIGLNPSGTAEA